MNVPTYPFTYSETEHSVLHVGTRICECAILMERDVSISIKLCNIVIFWFLQIVLFFWEVK